MRLLLLLLPIFTFAQFDYVYYSGTQFVTAGEDQVLAVWAVSDGRPIQKDVKPLPIYSALFTTKPNELMIVNEQQKLSYERVASP